MLSSTLSRIGWEKLARGPESRRAPGPSRRRAAPWSILRVHSDCRLQVDEELRHVDRLRIGAVLRTAGLARSRCALPGTARSRRADARAAAATPRSPRCPAAASTLTQIEPSLSSGRNSLPSCVAQAPGSPASTATAHGDTVRRRASAPAAAARYTRLQHADQRVFLASARFCPAATEAQQRHQRQREQQRADQRRDDRVRHRREDAAFVPLQGEDRNVRDDDDQHREQRRPADLHRRVEDRRAPQARCRSRRAASDSCRKMFSTTITAPSTMMPKSIAPSDSRFAGMPRIVRPMKVASSDSGITTATIAAARRLPRKTIQHQRHQQRAFEQVREHGVQRRVDQPGAVVERHDLHALRQHRAR